jgi:hypothetical protein
MPAPLVAALIVEQIAGQGYLIKSTFRGFVPKLPRVLVTCAAVVMGVYVTMLISVFVLGNLFHAPGVGEFVFTPAGLARNISHFLGSGRQRASACQSGA